MEFDCDPAQTAIQHGFCRFRIRFYTCFLSVRVCAVPRARLSAYQRCWYVNVSTVPAAGRRLVLVPLRISWLYSG